MRVWARCARWKGRPWARHGEGVTVRIAAFTLVDAFAPKKRIYFGPANLGETDVQVSTYGVSACSAVQSLWHHNEFSLQDLAISSPATRARPQLHDTQHSRKVPELPHPHTQSNREPPCDWASAIAGPAPARAAPTQPPRPATQPPIDSIAAAPPPAAASRAAVHVRMYVPLQRRQRKLGTEREKP